MLLVSMILLTALVAEEETLKEEIPQVEVPKSVQSFIPKGYAVLNFTKGDLNRDKIEDAILILKRDNESIEMEDAPRRPLFILIGEKNGAYKKAAENNTTVLTIQDGGVMGDPFEGVTIKNGYFSVEHYGGSAWRWTHIVTYKYDKKKKTWFLHKDGGESFHSADPEKVESKVLTVKDFGVVPFDEYNIFE